MSYVDDYAEIGMVLLIGIGIIVSALLPTVGLQYVAIGIIGIVAGKIFFDKRYKVPIFPFILLIVGLLIGYLIGAFLVSRLVLITLFVVTFSVTYHLHKRGIITTFKRKYLS